MCLNMLSETAVKAAKQAEFDKKKADLIFNILTLDKESISLEKAEEILELVKEKIRECAIISEHR